jgi:hypothetical protein
MNGAGDRVRTGDINLGKVALYQLSYSRLPNHHSRTSLFWKSIHVTATGCFRFVRLEKACGNYTHPEMSNTLTLSKSNCYRISK